MRFIKETDDTKELLNLFCEYESLKHQAIKLKKKLDWFVHKHFQTIRVTEKIYTDLEKNCFKKADLKSKTHLESKKEIFT